MATLPSKAVRNLRQLAEEKFRANESKILGSLLLDEPLKLFHELQVYKIELEMQNELLQEANSELEERVEERTRQLANLTHELSIILESAPVGIAKVIDSKQVWVNRKIEEMLQYSKEEMEFQTIRKLYSSLDVYERIWQEAYPALVQGEVFETKQELLRKDGLPVLVRYIGKAIAPPHLSQGTIWLLEDITGRQFSEHRLLFHGEIMKNLAEGVNVVRLDNSTIVFANARFETMFGYAPDELLGQDVALLNAPSEKDPEETKKSILAVLAATGEWHGEVRNIRKDGTPFWCYAHVSLLILLSTAG